MTDLSTTYMGLKLKNPVIVGSSGLTNSIAGIKELEAHGAAAVVLKSIFEEQILMESDSMSADTPGHSSETEYLRYYTEQHNLDKYLKLIEDAKKAVDIPVIASINCASADNWVSFAKNLQDSGADALELNMFIIPGDIKQKGEEIEKTYFDIISRIKEHVSIPLAVKLGSYFSGLAKMIFDLSVRDIAGLVLFNRFYRPDIDIEKEAITGSTSIFSTPEEIYFTLRWVGMMAAEVKCDLAASTGIHDGAGVVKCLLAGAKAVQIASVLYQKGPGHIESMIAELEDWMKRHKYKTLKEFTGKLAQENIDDPILYERTQFMKYYSSRE